MVARRRALSNKVVQPDYAGLSGVVFHGRYEGLVNNTNNSYGTVDGSGNVTLLKSVSPHATGVEFGSQGTAPTLSASGIVFGGAGNLRHTGASSVFNSFHFISGITNLKWAVHGVFQIGSSSNPDTFYAVAGNNGGASSNKGIYIAYDDRSSVPINNSLLISITRGTSQSFITLAGNTNIITPNRMMDVWVQVDKSQDQENQVQVFINGFRFVVSNRIDSSTMVTTPTYAMEIGAGGNAVGRAVMTLKEITFQNALNTDAFRQTFITARMFKYGVVSFPNMIDGIPISSDWVLTNTLDENRYYLTNFLCQNPTDPNTIVEIFTDGLAHVPSDGKVISKRVSTDKGLTWSAKSQVYDPGGTDSPGDLSAGYGTDGRLHVITDVSHTSAGPSYDAFAIIYLYSDDDGATWSSPVDITSSLAADGLASYRMYSTIIENDGVLMCAYYKVTDDTDATNSARYIFRSTNNGATWSSVLIQTGTTYRNETDIIGLDDDHVLAVTRDEVTLEYYQSMSSDNGATWSNQGALSFGETFTRATPVRLEKFQISGTDIIACYYSDRDRDIYKVIYAKASDLISSGLTGWNESTKFTLHQGSNSEHLHYGDVCHFDGGFESIAQYAIDAFPGSGSGTENEMYTLRIPTFQYPFIKSAFGL